MEPQTQTNRTEILRKLSVSASLNSIDPLPQLVRFLESRKHMANCYFELGDENRTLLENSINYINEEIKELLAL